MAGFAGPLGNYTYAITWWGLLSLIDEWNFTNRKLSLWRGRGARFVWITLPLSVIFWLFFEVLNLASPQWRYRGELFGVGAQVLFGFVSFATVIPIVVEMYWLTGETFRLSPEWVRRIRTWQYLLPALGIAIALIPAFNHRFWLNQAMWLAPALMVLPFTRLPVRDESAGALAIRIIVAGLASGVLWELLNWFSRTHWEYLILRSWPHIFQMPWIGYVGFIPFAFTVMVFYEFAERIPARAGAGVCLYAVAFAGLYILTVIYDTRGLWQGYDFRNSGLR
jgi:hypothetical protein